MVIGLIPIHEKEIERGASTSRPTTRLPSCARNLGIEGVPWAYGSTPITLLRMIGPNRLRNVGSGKIPAARSHHGQDRTDSARGRMALLLVQAVVKKPGRRTADHSWAVNIPCWSESASRDLCQPLVRKGAFGQGLRARPCHGGKLARRGVFRVKRLQFQANPACQIPEKSGTQGWHTGADPGKHIAAPLASPNPGQSRKA